MHVWDPHMGGDRKGTSLRPGPPKNRRPQSPPEKRGQVSGRVTQRPPNKGANNKTGLRKEGDVSAEHHTGAWVGPGDRRGRVWRPDEPGVQSGVAGGNAPQPTSPPAGHPATVGGAGKGETATHAAAFATSLSTPNDGGKETAARGKPFRRNGRGRGCCTP